MAESLLRFQTREKNFSLSTVFFFCIRDTGLNCTVFMTEAGIQKNVRTLSLYYGLETSSLRRINGKDKCKYDPLRIYT